MDDLSKYSGEEHMQRAPQLVTNIVRLNGQDGKFELKKVKEGLLQDEKTGKRAYPTEDLGQQIDLIFLRIRRKMVEKLQGRPDLAPNPSYTNEHNHKSEKLILTAPNGTEYGTSDELRQKYPDLRTHQIVYALYQGELVRLTVKGSSLGSESKPEDIMDFYSYMGSFQNNPEARDGKKDHFYDFVTELHSVKEMGKLGGYYTISFKRGHANSTETMEKVGAAMKQVHKFVTECDEYYQGKIGTKAAVAPEEVEPIIQMDEEAAEENAAEDIPF
jgi:hypothetical protein